MVFKQRAARVSVCIFGLLLLLTRTSSADTLYWDPEGTNVTTSAAGVWGNSGTTWSTSSSLSSSLVPWTPGSIACFCAGTSVTGNFTVTLTSTQICSGILNGTASTAPCNLILATSGGGTLSVAAGSNAFNVGTNAQITYNVFINGPGIIVFQGAGIQSLFKRNTYTGGTQLGFAGNDFTGTLNLYDSASLGTGPITLSSSGCTLVAPSSLLTITNTWNVAAPADIRIGSGTSTLTLTGPFDLDTSSVGLNIDNFATLAVSGAISGSGGITKSGPGKLTFNAPNTYTGMTVISNGTIAVTTNGSIANSSALKIYPTAKLDVSAITTFTLGANMPLIAFGNTSTRAMIAGSTSVSLSSNPVILSFTPTTFNGDTTHPALTVAANTLVLNNNSFTITNAAATPIGPGTYKMVDGFLAVSGTPDPNVTVYGLATNCAATLVVSNTALNLVVKPQTALTNISLSRTYVAGFVINSIGISATLAAPPYYPPPGEVVTVDLSGSQQTVKTLASVTNISATYPMIKIPSVTTNCLLTISYPGDATFPGLTNTSIIPANYFYPAAGSPVDSASQTLSLTNTAGLPLCLWSTTNASIPVHLWNFLGPLTEQPLANGSGDSVYSKIVTPTFSPTFYIIGVSNVWPFASPTSVQWIATDGSGQQTFFTTNTDIQTSGILMNLPSPPMIFGGPNSQTVIAGKNVGFNYGYSSTYPDMTAQLLFNDTNYLGAGILSLTNVTTEMSGNYALVVSNQIGATTSAPATLNVLPQPQLAIQSTTNSSREFTATAAPFQRYAIQTATNLTPPIAWTTIATKTATSSGFIDVIDSNPTTATNLFYRLQFP